MSGELARRIGAWLTKTGRWRAGMLTQDTETCEAIRLCWSDETYWHCHYMHGWLRVIRETMGGRYVPSFEDGPTRGAMEDILREERPGAVLNRTHGGGAVAWYTDHPKHNPTPDGATPGEAIARALVTAYEIPETP